jgi:SHS2 domain-containing protein
MVKDFEQIPHTADIEIRVFGATLAQLFEHAMIGMFQVIGPKVTGDCTITQGRLVCAQLPSIQDVDVSSFDRESLLVDFLSEAWYLSDVHNEAYLKADIHELTQTRIRATLYGVPVRGFDVVEIKAVTYHDLHITQVNGVWQTNIVFDI